MLRQVGDAGGGFCRIDAFEIDDMLLEEIDLGLHAVAGVGHALLRDARFGPYLGDAADGFADQRLGAAGALDDAGAQAGAELGRGAGHRTATDHISALSPARVRNV